jgi:chromosome segregation ATPase
MMQRSKNETRRAPRAPTSEPPLETPPLAHMQRQIAELEATLADTDARLKRARRESATADEMIGQMLARVAEVEGKLRAAQKQATDAEERAAAAMAQLAEERGADDDRARLRVELEAARTEATLSIAAAETAQEALLTEREQSAALRAQLAREREERESLRARVAEFAAVCEERDQALRREEELEAALARAKEDAAAARRAGDHEGANAADVQRLRGALGDVKRILMALEQRDADAARLRAGMLAAARTLLDKHAAEPAPPPAVEAAPDEPSSDGDTTQPFTSSIAREPAEGEDDETQFFLNILRANR